jgi:AraC-binding-like domain
MECRAESGDYEGEFRASGLRAMQVVVMDIMPITVSRTPKLISQADPDLLKMVCGGNSCVVTQDNRQAPLGTAEFALYDTRRPYEVACGTGGDQPTQMMTFMFPPSMLPLSRRRIAQLAAVRFPPRAGLGDLTSQFLLQLARRGRPGRGPSPLRSRGP